MRVFLFMIGIGAVIWGLILLLVAIGTLGIVWFIVAGISLVLGIYWLKNCDFSGAEDRAKKQRKLQEKQAKETEIRRQQFMEQEQWKQEAPQKQEASQKYCSSCGNGLQINETYCSNCGTEI